MHFRICRRLDPSHQQATGLRVHSRQAGHPRAPGSCSRTGKYELSHKKLGSGKRSAGCWPRPVITLSPADGKEWIDVVAREFAAHLRGLSLNARLTQVVSTTREPDFPEALSSVFRLATPNSMRSCELPMQSFSLVDSVGHTSSLNAPLHSTYQYSHYPHPGETPRGSLNRLRDRTAGRRQCQRPCSSSAL